jgi:hypothetical protein
MTMNDDKIKSTNLTVLLHFCFLNPIPKGCMRKQLLFANK